MQELHISMLGAQGTGKSSLLASMYYTFKKNAGELGFLMKPASADDSNQLNDKHQEMLEHLQGFHSVEKGTQPTEEDHEYSLDLGFRKDGVDDYWMKLHFWDFPGGWIIDNRERVIEQLNKSQVILIAVDTPSLVVDDIHGNYQLWHGNKNKPKLINDIFSEITPNTSKLVLFVPIKCEAWRMSTKGSQLIADQVRKGYDDLIASLKNCPKITLATTPVQTLGNYKWSYRTKIRDHQKQILKDVFKPINTDVNERALYEPREIDQPLIYILSFLSQQVRAFLNNNVRELKTDEIEENIEHREKQHQKRSLFIKFVDWLTGEDKTWEQEQQGLKSQFEQLSYEQQQLFSKLAQLQIPLEQLNRKRIDDKSDGFEVIQGKNQLLGE